METPRPSVREAIDRAACRARGDLPARYAAFDRNFSSLPTVCARCSRARSTGCRAATVAHVSPAGRRAGRRRVRQRSRRGARSPATKGGFGQPDPGQRRAAADRRPRARSGVSRGLSRPPHDRQPARRARSARPGRAAGSPLFSPQSLLHEAAASLGSSALAFPEPARLAFERDELFPLAGLDPPAPTFTSASAGSSTAARACRPRSPGSISTARSTFRAPPRRSSATR